MVMATLSREARFVLRDRAILAWFAFTLTLAIYSVWGGIREVESQKSGIETLLAADSEDRDFVSGGYSDWGGAAYGTFHLTYQPPTNFTFAAFGHRDSSPWRHRIRMLALEGQIYEADTTNPELALTGRFDFAFMAAVVLPLILIVALHDSRAAERAAGRYELLTTISGDSRSLWVARTGLRAGVICLCMILPLLVGGFVSSTPWDTIAAGAAIILAHGAFWALICYWLAGWKQSSSYILAALLGVWTLLAVIGPIAGRMIVERTIPIPSGAEIAMTQREAVNDAWDLPKATTMAAFLETHPEWTAHSAVERPFEWKWYYAFQHVGDWKTKPLSDAFAEGRTRRDRLASSLSLFAPPALTERAFQRLAGTDLQSVFVYERSVRAFHEELRRYYYPKLFLDEPFERSLLRDLPSYTPRGRTSQLPITRGGD